MANLLAKCDNFSKFGLKLELTLPELESRRACKLLLLPVDDLVVVAVLLGSLIKSFWPCHNVTFPPEPEPLVLVTCKLFLFWLKKLAEGGRGCSMG